MSKDITVDEIKEKFQKLQSQAQSLKEEKVKYEAQLDTLNEQYNTQLKVLLESTGASDLQGAVEVLKGRQESLNKLKESLYSTLEQYVGTVESKSDMNDIGSLML